MRGLGKVENSNSSVSPLFFPPSRKQNMVLGPQGFSGGWKITVGNLSRQGESRNQQKKEREEGEKTGRERCEKGGRGGDRA